MNFQKIFTKSEIVNQLKNSSTRKGIVRFSDQNKITKNLNNIV